MKVACGWLYALGRYGYPPSFEDALAAIAEAREWGFEAFEMEAIGEDNLHLLYTRRAELRQHIMDLGMTLVNFVPMLPDVVSLDRTRRARALDLFRRGAELGAYLATDMLMCDSYQPPLEWLGEAPGDNPIQYGRAFHLRISKEFSWPRVWENLVGAIRDCAAVAEGVGLRLGMELRIWETVANTDAFLRLHDAVRAPNLGVVFDVAHLHAQKEILPLSVEKLSSRIFAIHASDNDGRENQHIPPGQGSVDWQALYGALAKHGFSGYSIVDVGDCPDLAAGYQLARRFLLEIPK